MDRDLVVRAREGDRDAFASLVAARIARFDAVARLITRDPERAKDAVQEAFARAWRDLRALRDPTGSTPGCGACSSTHARTSCATRSVIRSRSN
jgi:DNA-directed RNA polymerase specialized sigma24 family protein